MPTGCAFVDCDKAVVGRCHECGREFCPDHRFVATTGAAVRNLCVECAVAAAETEAYACELRESSLARIHSLAEWLVSEGLGPTEAFVWTYRTEYRWWAFGRFGRYRVATPIRLGWPVGDYPWEGMVDAGHGASLNEVFMKPTYVDEHGLIAPVEATRADSAKTDLLTDEMCQEIADTMSEIAEVAQEQAHRHESVN